MSEEKYWKPSVTCDMVAVNSHLAKWREDGSFMNLVLIKRSPDAKAFPDAWALPGGFLEEKETLEECAVREFKEETGLDAKLLAPVGTFSAIDRDPRGRVISHAYMTMLISTDEQPLKMKAGDDAAGIALFNIKGKFNNEDGTSLTLTLRNVEKGDRMVYTTTFTRGLFGVLNAAVEYDEGKSNARLAFDHAEIIARAVLRAPDIIKTSNKFVQSPVAHVEKAEDGVAKPPDRELKAYLAK